MPTAPVCAVKILPVSVSAIILVGTQLLVEVVDASAPVSLSGARVIAGSGGCEEDTWGMGSLTTAVDASMGVTADGVLSAPVEMGIEPNATSDSTSPCEVEEVLAG